MAVSLSKVNVGPGESLTITIDGSSEVSLAVEVSVHGLVFVSGPQNSNKTFLRFSSHGVTQTTKSDRDMSMDRVKHNV